jgi:hypothetical protein
VHQTAAAAAAAAAQMNLCLWGSFGPNACEASTHLPHCACPCCSTHDKRESKCTAVFVVLDILSTVLCAPDTSFLCFWVRSVGRLRPKNTPWNMGQAATTTTTRLVAVDVPQHITRKRFAAMPKARLCHFVEVGWGGQSSALPSSQEKKR